MSANPKQPQAGDVFFYIIGGEYEDMSFERLVTSTSTIEGPFQGHDSAKAAWSKLNEKAGGDAVTRYEIIQVAHKIDRQLLLSITRAPAPNS